MSGRVKANREEGARWGQEPDGGVGARWGGRGADGGNQ